MRRESWDILLCQRFLPEFGGSIRWMYEVYRRWPRPVEVITHDYYRHPPRTPEFPDAPARPDGGISGGDHGTDPNLKMDRRNIFLRDWGLENPRRLWRYGRMTRAVGERLRAHPQHKICVHCIHAVPEAASLIPLKMLYGHRLRIISYAHGEEVTACCSSRQLRWLLRRAYRAADLVIANSRYTAAVVAPHVAARKVHVVNPGVQLDEFNDAAMLGAQWRAEQGYNDRLIVLTIGRLDPRKNQAAVLQAVAQLLPHHPNLLYILGGEGRNRPALEELTQRLNVANHVLFLGNVDGQLKRALYGGCDVFAMPAIRDGTDVEGFGMVFLEAGACGKASLAGKAGGQAEAVRDGQTGLVVEGTDQTAVTGALAQLLADPTYRKQLGQAGRKYAEGFDWPLLVQRILDLTDNVE